MAAVYSRQIFQLRGMETDMDNSISAASSVETFNEKKTFRGELALVIAVLINSYAFSLLLPNLTLGTWTYIFQGTLILSLMIMRKKFVPMYLFSFVVGFAFSMLLDLNKAWINILPTALGWRIVYFVISYLLLSVGIAFSNRCKLPIVPTDLFPRELADITKVGYPKIKIAFDVICLAVTAAMTFLFLGRLYGLGIGTVLAAFTMGKMGGIVGNLIDRKYVFTSFLSK